MISDEPMVATAQFSHKHGTNNYWTFPAAQICGFSIQRVTAAMLTEFRQTYHHLN